MIYDNSVVPINFDHGGGRRPISRFTNCARDIIVNKYTRKYKCTLSSYHLLDGTIRFERR